MKELTCLSSLCFSLQKILTVKLERFLVHILRQMLLNDAVNTFRCRENRILMENVKHFHDAKK